jgi:hypothetical protein
LAVVLDHIRRPDRGTVRGLAEFETRSALTKKVPALVECDLERTETLLLFGVQALAHVSLLELMLFLGETPYVGDKLFVFHVQTSL